MAEVKDPTRQNDFRTFGKEERYIDGARVTDNPRRGGVISLGDGRYETVAPIEAALPGAGNPGLGQISNSRLGNFRLSWADFGEALGLPPKRAIEVELAALAPGGDYADVVGDEGSISRKALGRLETSPELFKMMLEVSAGAYENPEEFRSELGKLLGSVAIAAMNDGLLIAPLAVIGQRPTSTEDQNPHPFIKWAADRLTDFTGFTCGETFRVLGVQPHGDILDFDAALQAAPYLYRLAPVLTAASLAGPFIDGGLEWASFPQKLSPKQMEHMRQVRIRPEHVSGRRKSWRNVLRAVGSSNGITYQEPAPQTAEEYLEAMNYNFADGQRMTVATPGRSQPGGQHTNLRYRPDLGKRGTIELACYDSFGGNLAKLAAFTEVSVACIRNLQLMILEGRNPEQEFPALFGRPDGVGNDELSHKGSLLVSQKGADVVSAKKVNQMMRLAQMYETNISNETKRQVRLSYTSTEGTREVIKAWIRENTDNAVPSMAGYHATGVGCPADWMRARYDALTERGTQPAEAVRDCEMDAAKAYMTQFALNV